MKFNNKYLGIFSIIFLISTIFILYEYRKNPLQEGLISTQNNNSYFDYSSGGIRSPNSVVANAVKGVSNNSQQSNNDPITDTNSKFVITSSNKVENTTASITNNMDVISQGSTNCDPNTTYSMRNIMQDNDGNIIIRYMDTCGKYYSYQYNQSVSKVQNAVTPPAQTQPPAQQTQESAASSNAVKAGTNNISVTVDANTINDVVSKLLNQVDNSVKGTPPPVVYPT